MSTLSVGTIKSASSAAPVIQNSSGTEKGQFAKAWVNFNGTGTVAIRDSFNVSSITDDATGEYTINFANAMSDTNYLVVGMSSQDGTGDIGHFDAITFLNLTTSDVECECFGSPNEPGTETDSVIVGAAIFGAN